MINSYIFNKINLIKVDILSNCSSKDSYAELEHSSSFNWEKAEFFDNTISKNNNTQSITSNDCYFDMFLETERDKENNISIKKAPLAPRNKNKISFNFDKKFLKEVNKKMLSPSSQFTIQNTPINNEKPPE